MSTSCLDSFIRISRQVQGYAIVINHVHVSSVRQGLAVFVSLATMPCGKYKIYGLLSLATLSASYNMVSLKQILHKVINGFIIYDLIKCHRFIWNKD